jgi:hypothetical protein
VFDLTLSYPWEVDGGERDAGVTAGVGRDRAVGPDDAAAADELARHPGLVRRTAEAHGHVVHAVVDGGAAEQHIHELVAPAAHDVRPEDDLGAVEREAAGALGKGVVVADLDADARPRHVEDRPLVAGHGAVGLLILDGVNLAIAAEQPALLVQHQGNVAHDAVLQGEDGGDDRHPVFFGDGREPFHGFRPGGTDESGGVGAGELAAEGVEGLADAGEVGAAAAGVIEPGGREGEIGPLPRGVGLAGCGGRQLDGGDREGAFHE